ncbi:protein kinase domain-containing protein [Marinactinospora thermotolerans]|uniref:mitogen-activated protein kinase kinase n=1 Tax=Marinactinospora thermotolerans DSM 45154 TaxID=1122192 RepID=A0A1T4KXJ1_9ACTN|nr:protein kinase [Marinactinospora thermotolerans]SJZ47080.1 Serine/threonine protein kinase [Marinactinospora thermotolerans DSM 45154]
MATPDPSDPTAPTQRIEPAAAGPRSAPDQERTRRVTALLRPGNRTRVAPAPAPGGETAVHTRRLGATASPTSSQPWWRRLLRPLLDWLARLVSRVVIGPAGDLDHAVPAELRRSYEVLGHIGSGGEAVVYLAEPIGAASEGGAGGPRPRVALKVYRPGHDINRELLDRLRARGTADPHTPAIHGYGHARSAWGEEVAWEAQEYFAEGSLRAIMDRSPLPEDEARGIVAAVAQCLHHWQDSLQHNHTDVKPENLLVRATDPPVFALTDFGGAVRATMSRVYGGLAITEAYAAPEVVEGRREAPAAWWSLGIMVHELMTGRRPERGENWLTARNSEVDVSAIPDERWRLLARGLLTPVPRDRWGYAEVTQWLAGERPQVVKTRRHAPIKFADVSHDDPPSLAFDLLDRSDKGEVWLRTHWPALRTWLDREVNDYTFDRAHLTVLDAHPERVHVAISALAARFVPGMPPRYRGHEVTAEGVLALATGEGSRHAALREAVELGALGLAARHWCDHPACRAEGTNRCALLERVQHEVPLIMRQVEATVAGLAARDDHETVHPGRHEWDAGWARAVELVLDPDSAGHYRRLLRAQSWHPAHRSDAPRVPWWREQRRIALKGRGGVTTTNAALVMALLTLPTAAREGELLRQRERADSRALWRGRRERMGTALSDGWASARERVTGAGRSAAPAAPDGRSGSPWERLRPRRLSESERIDRHMERLQRAMRAGRCRRLAYPAALLGLLDGSGLLLWHTRGLYSDQPWIASAHEALTALRGSALVSPVAELATSLLGLLPAGAGLVWWFPVALGSGLFVAGRVAAGQRRRARTRLVAGRLAVAGSAVMLVRLLSSGFFLVGMGVLIPLSLVLG